MTTRMLAIPAPAIAGLLPARVPTRVPRRFPRPRCPDCGAEMVSEWGMKRHGQHWQTTAYSCPDINRVKHSRMMRLVNRLWKQDLEAIKVNRRAFAIAQARQHRVTQAIRAAPVGKLAISLAASAMTTRLAA